MSALGRALATGNLLAIGLAAPAAMAMVYATGGDAISMAMLNEVSAQQGMQTIAKSTVVTTCAGIISAGASKV